MRHFIGFLFQFLDESLAVLPFFAEVRHSGFAFRFVPAHVDRALRRVRLAVPCVGGDRKSDGLIHLFDLSRDDAHEEDQENEEHVDHRRYLEFRLSAFYGTASSGHGMSV